jgi:hypothetical protein
LSVVAYYRHSVVAQYPQEYTVALVFDDGASSRVAVSKEAIKEGSALAKAGTSHRDDVRDYR